MPRHLSDDVQKMLAGLDPNAFRERIVARKFCAADDLRDVALAPILISREEHAVYEALAQRVAAAALAEFAARLDRAAFTGDSFQRLMQSLPVRQQVISGNARFDFLETAEGPKLVELNFLGVGTTARPHQASAAIVDCVPELSARYGVLHPTDAFRRQLDRHGCKTLALLTKDNDREYVTPWLDRILIQEQLAPVEVLIIPRAEWDGFAATPCGLSFHGKKIDAIYPRELTWRPSIEEGIDLCRFFLDTGVRCYDHWGLVLIEDKDLRFLTDQDPSLAPCIPKTWSLGEQPADLPPDRIVLKRRHDHGGEGVFVGPAAYPTDNHEQWLVQERVTMNRLPVRSLLGFEGLAAHDVATHVCFDYDLARRALIHCEVSGYLARYAPAGDVVNISLGGGVIPVLVER
jgi:hypothetical protein